MIYVKGSNQEFIEIQQGRFPDGTLLLKTYGIDFEHDPITIKWLYENDAELFTIICLAKKAHWKTLILPYVPHARQDRVKNEEDTFTLKYFAETINSLNFDSVWILDPHSNVTPALINNVVVETPEKYIDMAIADIYAHNGGANANPIMAFFPDEGACKRYSDMAGLQCAFGIKKRDWQTGKILGLDAYGDVEDIQGRDILIIDDISSKGTTFLFSARKLKELGARNVYLYITHCEETILDGEIFSDGIIQKVYTTNSIFTPKAIKRAIEMGVKNKIEVFAL